MKIAEVKQILDADVITGDDMLNKEVQMSFAADLMSDVLTFARGGSVLLTGLTSSIVIRTADTLDIAAIVFVRGKRPDSDAVELAREKKIILLTTKYIMFESCGRLYKAGMRGSIQNVSELQGS